MSKYTRQAIHQCVIANLMHFDDSVGSGGDPLTLRLEEDCGLDSFDLLTLVSDIEADLDVDGIAEYTEANVRTVADLIALFCQHCGADT